MSERIVLKNAGTPDGLINISAEKAGILAGRTIVAVVGKTAFLEDLRVHRNNENRGIIAKMLLKEAEKIASSQGATRMIRFGMFCDADSPTEYARTVRLMVNQGYKFRLVYLTKNLAQRN